MNTALNRRFRFFLSFVLLCAGSLHAQQSISLNNAIADMARFLGNRIPHNSKTAVISFNTSFTALSNYITEELIAALAKNPALGVTPFRDLKPALQAAGFKIDSETTTQTAQSLGRRLGVSAVVFGLVSPYGASYRLTVVAVETSTGREYWTTQYTLQNDSTLANMTRTASPAASQPASAPPAGPLSLDETIMYAGQAVEEKLTAGAKLAVLNFSSASEIFSDYVIEELSGVLVANGKITIVERRSLDLLRKEMDLQLSGDVSDDSAQAIGRRLGAQAIVSGSLTNMGSVYRFRIKVINVETARIEAQVSYNLRNDEQVAFLLHGNQQSAPPVAAAPKPAPAPAPAASSPSSAPAPRPAPATPAPAPTAPVVSGDQSRPGLYAGNAFQGEMDLLDAVDWLAINSQNNGVYTIVLGSDQKASNIAFNYNNKRVSISLKASGGERKIAFDTNNPTYALFAVGAGVTFTLENGITITGLQNNGSRFVTVEGGTFIMNGGTLRDNKSAKDYGGGVYIVSGTFVMNNGTISGNSAGYNGGGVYIESGGFTINGGTISGNSARNGGGVYVKSGTFTMNGGTISGNSSSYGGGGVYVNSAVFTKSGTGGVIYGSNAPEGQANKARYGGDAVYISSGDKKRNNTARASNGLDSTKNGAAGGWE